MGIIGWIVLGLAVGAIAKAFHLGRHERGGVSGTLALGIVGALLGGFIASVLGIGSIGSFFISLATWLIAIVGAFLALAIHDAAVEARQRPRGA
jgi:uncharacterized membrane protein YeaQ/YmgE (transglycosylase-associated protein family)